MSFDAHTNFAYSTVLTAPAPALSGVTVVLQAGDGAKFPAAPFNVTIWPIGVMALASNAEIARVTAKVGDTLTITRAQEGTAAIAIGLAYQVAATITAKTLTDIEAAAGLAHGTIDPVDPPGATDIVYVNHNVPSAPKVWANGFDGHWYLILG